ncbi:MAG: cyclase family protein [Lautropia sp.]
MTAPIAVRMDVPDYAGLLARTDAPAGSSWGIFGRDDELGTLNFITPERVRHAASLIRRGDRFNLDKALDAFTPPLASHRRNPVHRIVSNSTDHRDDYVDGLYLQGSSQIDSLRHFRHGDYGFYNGHPDSDIVAGKPTLGINRYAEHGIVGRGVLLDLERYLARQGRALDHRAGEPFRAALLDEVADAQGVAFHSGDIVMVRTGWMAHYFNVLTDAERASLPANLCSPGLLQEQASVRWLWDRQVSVIASDNVGIEAFPLPERSPLLSRRDMACGCFSGHAAMMHPTIIGLLGLCLGELWDLEALARDCAATGIYECMVSCKPLNLTGGVGSPANAMAIV